MATDKLADVTIRTVRHRERGLQSSRVAPPREAARRPLIRLGILCTSRQRNRPCEQVDTARK